MQLMSDAITVLGSRHGLFIEPCNRRAYLIRSTLHPGIPCEVVAGLEVDGEVCHLPLTSEGSVFDFHDQDMTPTSLNPDLARVGQDGVFFVESSRFCPGGFIEKEFW